MCRSLCRCVSVNAKCCSLLKIMKRWNSHNYVYVCCEGEKINFMLMLFSQRQTSDRRRFSAQWLSVFWGDLLHRLTHWLLCVLLYSTRRPLPKLTFSRRIMCTYFVSFRNKTMMNWLKHSNMTHFCCQWPRVAVVTSYATSHPWVLYVGLGPVRTDGQTQRSCTTKS